MTFAPPRVEAAVVTTSAVERQAERTFRQMKARLPVARDAEARAYVELQASNVLGIGAQIGLDLPYDRKQETQADAEGLRLMSRAGFDPRASLTLWKNMSRQNGGSPPAFLSTHPSPDNRIDRLIGQLAPTLMLYNEAQSLGFVPECEAAAD